MSEKIAVIGLGYVGLPLLVALKNAATDVIGFDIDPARVAALRQFNDWTGEVDTKELENANAHLTHNPDDLKECSFYIVTVPTPIDHAKRPDLAPILGASTQIGNILKETNGKTVNGLCPIIVYESTVYPGLTEEICGAKIAETSGLKQGQDFKLGYSPERINPGDKTNRLETIVKIISAEDETSLDRLETIYGKIINAGLHRAANIRVAEAAKVLENTQRDLNVALMNELAIICDRLGLRTHDVLAAAGTKWNFLKFMPGLVGGHCIGVDPYYLTARAEELGYHPEVILAGRRINDSMPVFIAQKTLKLLVNGGHLHAGARIGILGLAFKENVRDLRNSRVPEIVAELKSYGLTVLVHDPLADPHHAQKEYGIELSQPEELVNLNALILAVPHQTLLRDLQRFMSALAPNSIVIDVKSVLDPNTLPAHIHYWSL